MGLLPFHFQPVFLPYLNNFHPIMDVGVLRRTKQMAPRTVNPQTQSCLFSLPAEIRNDIYTRVLTVVAKNDPLEPVQLTSLPDNPEKPTVLSLLQICRLVHDEAYGIFFSTQPMKLTKIDRWPIDKGNFTDLVRPLGILRLEAFCDLRVDINHPEDITLVLKGLRHFRGLKAVQLHTTLRTSLHMLHTKLLRREASFMRRACAALPTRLQHFHVLCVTANIAEPLTHEERQAIHGKLLGIL